MDSRTACLRLRILTSYMSIYAATLLTLCEARSPERMLKFHDHKLPENAIPGVNKQLKVRRLLDDDLPLDLSDAQFNPISSPFNLPRFESLAPDPLPEETPPFCIDAPLTPPPTLTTVLSPIGSELQPPPPPPGPSKSDSPIKSPPSKPSVIPSPHTNSPVPIPPEYEHSPPSGSPSPPSGSPSPPHYRPSLPPKDFPTPPNHLPPVVFPPRSIPPPPHNRSETLLWCVAKPTVPDPIIQEALDYACGTDADCQSIQPNGSCYHPVNLLGHASYAFNSYWQNTKAAGGTCDFGGTAMLVTADPSSDECHFIYN